MTALKPPAEWLSPNWIPQNPTLENFSAILSNPSLPVFRWFLNSAVLAAVVTALTVALDAAAAYAYARLKFPGRNLLFGVMLSTLVMPGIIFLVPNYLTIAALGGLNRYWGVVVPGLAGVFGVFFLRQFFSESAPRDRRSRADRRCGHLDDVFARGVAPLPARPVNACHHHLFSVLERLFVAAFDRRQRSPSNRRCQLAWRAFREPTPFSTGS